LFEGDACQDIGADGNFGLVYANYGLNGRIVPTRQFNDFTPFGGWTDSNVKQFQGNVTIPLNCGETPWHAFVDLYSFKSQ
jgi:hypothetical protein